jgi:hypothetical protein
LSKISTLPKALIAVSTIAAPIQIRKREKLSTGIEKGISKLFRKIV